MAELSPAINRVGPPLPGASLLATKLYIPSTRSTLVARPRLLALLNQGLSGRLTLVSAPAGFGKTTLLSEWLNDLRFTISDLRLEDEKIVNRKSEIQNLKVAWLSLDAGDNDPIRFWTYSIAALQLLQPTLGESALMLLQATQPPALEPLLSGLLNDIAAFADELALVLDDYHLIENASIHNHLTFLLEHLPPNMHLILTSRTDRTCPWPGCAPAANWPKFAPPICVSFLRRSPPF